MEVNALKCYPSLHFVWDSKVAQMNVQHSLIRKSFFFTSSNGAITVAEASKTILGVKGMGAVNHGALNRLLKKFFTCCKSHDDQAMSSWSKTVDSEVELQAIDRNPMSRIQRVSGELCILQNHVIRHFHDLIKNINLLNCTTRYQNIANF